MYWIVWIQKSEQRLSLVLKEFHSLANASFAKYKSQLLHVTFQHARGCLKKPSRKAI